MLNIDDRLLPKVDEAEMWLILHLAKRLGESFTTFPSNSTLLKDTGWHIEKLQRVKKSLVEKRIIKVKTRKNTSNLYTINSEFIGVFINGKGKTVEVFEGDGKTDIPRNFGDPENSLTDIGKHDILTVGNSDPKVLTTEVLTNNSLSDKDKIIAGKVNDFKKTTYPFIDKYGIPMLKEFCDYWGEPTINGTRLKWELERTWNITGRLARWKKNDEEKNAKLARFGQAPSPTAISDPRSYHEPRTP